MTGLDTNLLVRYFIRDDPAQTSLATGTIERLCAGGNGPGFINLVTLMETLWVLRRIYGLKDKEIVAVVQQILQIGTILVQNEQEVFHATAVFTSGQGSFPDALIAAFNRAAGCATTLTFDQRAARIPGFEIL